jgi:exopolyphosphatase/guanosine-5'-triphosphate,3'-diphosphate pyrophosphatase
MLAAVDVGSNTVRLLLGEVVQGTVTPVRYERHITRLAGGFDPRRGLASQSMDNTLAALVNIADAIKTSGADLVRVVGTEALRRANNGPEFVRQVKERTGLQLEIIDGEVEARLSCAGVFAALDPRPGRCLMFDIGGGSTEFVLYVDGRVVFQRSYPLGVVDLCENFSDPVNQQRHILSILDRVAYDLTQSSALGAALHPSTVLVGTAGTVTTLAAIKLGMTVYNGLRVNNLNLFAHDLDSLFHHLNPLTDSQREQVPGLEKGRGDLIVPGIRIVLGIFDHFQKDSLKVSDFGLLEGLLLAMSDARSVS